AADVERLLLALLLPRLDDIDRDAHRCPHVVVVHARGHHVDQDVARPELGYADGLLLERVARLAKPLGADQLREHALGHDTEVRDLAELVDVTGGGGWARHGALEYASRPAMSPVNVRRQREDERQSRSSGSMKLHFTSG